MKIAIWRTGHPIADTVANALRQGLKDSALHQIDLTIAYYPGSVHVAYGILRGTSAIFQFADNANEHWFNVDRGYFNPGHFDGYYRISYKGTQAKWHEGIPQADIGFELEDWKPPGAFVLICPPTVAVKQFFGIDWIPTVKDASTGYKYIWRDKNMTTPINWDEICGVITFNSSIGWQALQRGIPCISDLGHSIVGSYYTEMLGKLGLDYSFDNIIKVDREPLFRAMRAHQFTLAEIREGKAWPLLNHYLKTS